MHNLGQWRSMTAGYRGEAKQRCTYCNAVTERQAASKSNNESNPTARLAILGASGYTGADCIRLAFGHPALNLKALTAERQAGKTLADVYPHLGWTIPDAPDLVKVTDVDFDNVDVAFCCLPHATTQDIILQLPKHVKVVDLSADFRLRDVSVYKEWYGGEHLAPELQKEAVYGLTELYRSQVQQARLVANPGCYPTCSVLPLAPLLSRSLIAQDDIIIDAKSGVSGAGRSAKEANLYTEVAEGLHSYGVGHHRHMPEIEQALMDAAGKEVRVSFTPHLIPMSRGMQCTIYVKMTQPDGGVEHLRSALGEHYKSEEFVTVLEPGRVPHTRHVRGSNHCLIAVAKDRLPDRAIIISVIDNLVKGASGQAMQNLNLLLGVPEATNISGPALFP